MFRRAPRKPNAVDAAIEAHRAAWAVLQALGDNVDDATLGAATETESAAMRGLCAVLRVASVNEFLAAQRYITDFKLKNEDAPMEGDGYGALAIAARSYFELADLNLAS
jgi:hypothetical protein